MSSEMSDSQTTLLQEDWGRSEYGEAFERQKAYVAEVQAGKRSHTLVLTEHDPVFTMGIRKGADRHLVWSKQMLEAQGVSVYQSNRGGDITYHGPGQITGYPILDLSRLRDLHAYLRLIEEMLIQTVAEYGLTATRREGKTGIWLEDRKIAAIGVAVKTWVSYHGFALNVNTNLQHFMGIVPCGITDGTVTSIEKELGKPVDMSEVKAIVIEKFKQVLLPKL